MPQEYKSLKTILERLAKYNYLGNETIYFSIIQVIMQIGWLKKLIYAPGDYHLLKV